MHIEANHFSFHPQKMLEVTLKVKNVRTGSFFTPQNGIFNRVVIYVCLSVYLSKEKREGDRIRDREQGRANTR